MKTVGYIKQFNEEDFSKEIEEYLKEDINKDREMLIEYMQKGVLCVPLMGCVEDPLDEVYDEEFIAYMASYTDGVYLWPQYVIEFMKKYPTFHLDQEFVDYVKENKDKTINPSKELVEKIENEYYAAGNWDVDNPD